MKKLIISSVIACNIALSFSFSRIPVTAKTGMCQTQPEKAEKYRLVVSFISKGAGANSEQRKAFLDYVEGHPKKPVFKKVLWGREGETDYCFKLTELSKKDQLAFIAEVKKLTAGSDLAIISEDAECPHHARLQTKN